MSSKAKNYLIIVLFAATVSSSLIAWNQVRRTHALQEDLLKAAAAANAVKPKPLSATAARAAAKVAPEIEPPPVIEDPNSQQRPRGGTRANFAALSGNPEFAKAMNLQQRAALDSRYAALFKQLNLSPAELEKFKGLLVERQSSRMDVMAAARESGLNPRDNRDEINKLITEAQAEVDANLKATLGDTKFNQYQSYDATQSQRSVVGQLDQRLSYSATPLNSTQSDFLINALATGAPTPTDQQPAGGPGNWGGGGNRTTITDAVIQQAQSVLTPDQVAALKQLQEEQKAQEKVRELMRSSGGNATRTPRN